MKTTLTAIFFIALISISISVWSIEGYDNLLRFIISAGSILTALGGSVALSIHVSNTKTISNKSHNNAGNNGFITQTRDNNLSHSASSVNAPALNLNNCQIKGNIFAGNPENITPSKQDPTIEQ